MNMHAAFSATLELARKLDMDMMSSDIPELDYPHLVSMYQRILEADNRGEPFSEGKLGRWLGWAQACVVVSGASLDEMKEINKKYA